MDRSKSRYSSSAKTGFVLYAIACLIFFVFIRFPYDILKDKAEKAMSTALMGTVALGHVHSSLPMGISIEGASFNTIPIADRFDLSPGILSLFIGRATAEFEADLISGSIDGRISTPLNDLGEHLNLTCVVNEMDFGSYTDIFPEDAQPKGIISGNIKLDCESAAFEKAGGRVSFVWKGGQMPIFIRTLPINVITFETFEVNARMDKGVFTIDKAELNGDVSGSIKGSIHVRRNINHSRLNLSGEVMLPQGVVALLGIKRSSQDQGLRFTMRGTVGRPRLRWLKR